MKAVIFERPGGPEVLRHTEVADPRLSEGEVLVRVKSVGVNRLDIWLRSGRYKTDLPRILGADVAGDVSMVSRGVTKFSTGDRVLVYPVINDGTCKFCLEGHENRCVNIGLLGAVANGGYAEYIKVREEKLIPIQDFDFKPASAIPVNFATTWSALVTQARVGPEDSVFVWGAGGGVGHAAIQISKLFGANVIAAASTEEKLSAAKKLGADHTMNSRDENIAARVREATDSLGATIVFDHVGGDTWPKSLDCLRKGGKLISLGLTSGSNSNVDVGRVYRNELRIFGVYAFTKYELAAVTGLVRNGKLKPSIYKEYPLGSAAEAHQLMESRESFGKILLLPE